MPKVEIKKNHVWIDKKKVPLISGEVHYWRLNPGNWEEILKRVRELGIQIVSTYVPWDYHEYEQGRFDFTGQTNPSRDLKSFLELTRKKGFWVVIRPGPYIYSEWPRDGVPEYAYQYHRLHPQFLQYANRYLKEVVSVLHPFLATRPKGHILLLQADNEVDPWPDIFGSQYGLAGSPGLFQKYLEKRYSGRIEALNENWGTRYRCFDEAGPFIATMLQEKSGLPLKGDKELRRNIDYFEFKHYYAKQYAQWAVQTYRKLGVDVPIYLNVYPFFYAHDWAEMQKVSDMVGVDLYPSNEFSEDALEHRKLMDKVRFLKNVSRVPFIAEFQSGVWHGRHYETNVLTPNHYRILALSAVMGGAAGWNWYMLVNRDNWYMSPINEWGRVRGELYDVFKQIVRVMRKIDLPQLNKVTEIAVTFNPMQYAVRTVSHQSPVLVGLYESDIDYELYDPRQGVCEKKYLFYSGNQWLDIRSQENLKRFVKEGGTLIAFQDYPRKDESFRFCSWVGFEEPQSILFEFKRKFEIQLAEGRPKIPVVSSVYSFGDVPGKKITADMGSYGRKTVGYIKKIGKGSILHLGLDPNRELVREVLDYLRVPLVSYSITRDIKTAVFKRGNRYYLVAVNNGDENKGASVYLPFLGSRKKSIKVYDLFHNEQDTCYLNSRHPFNFEIGRKDGKVWEFRLD